MAHAGENGIMNVNTLLSFNQTYCFIKRGMPMFIGAAIFLVLIVMGGIIAFLGDRIGSKVGKKRMTLFGLRPKYTSVIVTIISGVLISFPPLQSWPW